MPVFKRTIRKQFGMTRFSLIPLERFRSPVVYGMKKDVETGGMVVHKGRVRVKVHS